MLCSPVWGSAFATREPEAQATEVEMLCHKHREVKWEAGVRERWEGLRTNVGGQWVASGKALTSAFTWFTGGRAPSRSTEASASLRA